MYEYPPVTIVMTTFFTAFEREQVAEQAARSWENNLRYNGLVHLHVADDGTSYKWKPRNSWWNNTTYSTQGRQGVGASLNAGFKKAFESSPLVLYMVDDWALTETFNITPWIKVLMEREDVGVVRLGPPHPNLMGRIEMLTDDWQGWGLRLDRHDFAFGHRPALYHKRFIDYYGLFKERCSALECEQDYNDRFCGDVNGCDIVLALPHKFMHLESESLSSLEPS